MKTSRKTQAKPPLSPHLSVYKWRYTYFNPSVIHRATGVFLSVGFVLLAYLLVALASGEEAWNEALTLLKHPLGTFYLTGLIWSFSFHLLNGVRHLFWDAGYGFKKRFARHTGYGIWIGATLTTIAYCWWAGLWL